MRKYLSKPLSLLAISLITLNANAQQPTAGDRHSFYLCPNKVPVAWGPDRFGALGTNDGYDHFAPVLVNGLADIIKVEASRVHSVFLKNDGTVLTVGGNGKGQLGDGSTTDKDVPATVTGLTDVVDISANHTGDFTLFLKSDGTVWACGDNITGQLGDGTSGISANKTTPVQANGLTGIISISAGEDHSLYLAADSSVWASGANNYGQFGNGSLTGSNVPVKINGLTGIIAVEAGTKYSLFLKSDGTVWACGENSNGNLGDSSSTDRNIPVQVIGLDSVIQMAAGQKHSLFLKHNGTVWVCGGDIAAHGNGTFFGPSAVKAYQINTLTDIASISAGSGFSIFVKKDGTVLTCGKNEYGQLGTGSISGLPSGDALPITLPEGCSMVSIPASPTNLTATPVNSIRLDWQDNSDNEDGFYLESTQDTLSGNWDLIATLDANDTTFTHTGLTVGLTYYYRVSAYNANGQSAWSNIAGATDGITGVGGLSFQKNPEIYPNPASDFVLIKNLPVPSAIFITDLAGKIIHQSNIQAGQGLISTQEFANGIYLMQIHNAGKINSHKLVINK